MAWKPGLLPAMVSLLGVAVLPLQAQTLIHYTLNDTANDENLFAEGLVPNAGTLGNGMASNSVLLSITLPTNGVPPGAGNLSIYCNGNGGILAPGTQQLNNTAIFNAGGFTYETWCYWIGGGDINAMIDYAGTQKLVRPATSTGPEMEYYNTNDSPVYNFIGSAASNQWHYVAVVFTATALDSHTNVTGNFTYYLDTNEPTGSLSNVTISPFGDSLDRTIGVGMHPEGFSSDYFNGLIYEPRVTLGALPYYNLLFKPGVVVTTTADSGAGSLSDAVANAPNGAAITFAPALNGQTIYLDGGPIELDNDVTIDGSALPNGIQIDGGGSSQIFSVALGVTASVLNSLTIQNGNDNDGYWGSGGGGIDASEIGTLTVNNCTFIDNLDNGNTDGGGAIHLYDGTLTVNNCTFTGNQGLNTGNNNGGGAIFAYAGTVSVNSCTFVGNQADAGGAIYFNGVGGHSLYLTNTIACSNTASTGANVKVVLGGYTATSNLLDTNALLAALGNYGGPTQTMPPLFGSPAIDAGSDAAASMFTTDQRGYPRLSGAHVDIGAVEAQYASTNNRPLLKNATWTGGGTNTFQFGFTNAPDADFCVLTTTNLALPLSWTALGEAIQTSPGQYQFTNTTVTNAPKRFYRVVSP